MSGIATPHRHRRRRHRSEALTVKAVERGQECLRAQLAVTQAERRAGIDECARVVLLVAAAECSRDEHAGQADGGQFGEGTDAGAADDEVRTGEEAGHVIGELQGGVARARVPLRILGALTPGEMDHLRVTGKEVIQARPDCRVDPERTLAAPGHEKGARRHGRRPELKAAPKRQPCHLHGALHTGSRERRADRCRATREEAGGQPRDDVLLVEHVRHPAQASSEEGRRHGVAADAQDDVRLEGVDDREAPREGRRQDDRQGDVGEEGIAVQTLDGDRLQVEPGPRDDAFLRSAPAADQEDRRARILSAAGLRDGERRVQVTAGPAPRYQQSHPTSAANR